MISPGTPILKAQVAEPLRKECPLNERALGTPAEVAIVLNSKQIQA